MSFDRPIGFESEKRDCTVRALSLCMNIPYEQVHKVCKIAGRRNKRGFYFTKHALEIFEALKLYSWNIKRSGSVEKLIRTYPEGRLLVIRRGHAFCVIDGVPHDAGSLKCHVQMAWLLEKKEAIQ
jgi:hypothetical protein